MLMVEIKRKVSETQKGVLIKSSVDDRTIPLVFSRKSRPTYLKQTKSRGTFGAFLNSLPPKPVVIGTLLHIGAGVPAPDRRFFAKKTRRCTKNQCVAASFLGATLSTPPSRFGERRSLSRDRSPSTKPYRW